MSATTEIPDGMIALGFLMLVLLMGAIWILVREF